MSVKEGPRGQENLSRRRFFRAMTAAAGVTAVAAISTRASAQSNRPVWQDPSPPSNNPAGPPCFLRGTPILTPSGEVPVETLSIGDRVTTVSGQERAIKWIGQRTYRRGATAQWPASIQPIRVARSALADNVPTRDLYLSPRHALYIDGVLIPVMHLVNGTSIRPAMSDDRQDVTYFHIELETHDVILAAGAPAETYRELHNRETFGNFAEYYRLYGTDARSALTSYAPVVQYRGRRDHVKAMMRLGVSRLVDVRDPIQVACDRLAARAAALAL